MLTLVVVLLVAQPQGEIIWSQPGIVGGIYNAIITQDINHDGHPDVAAVPYYGAPPPITLFCHSGLDGAEIWTQTDCLGTWGTQSLAAIADENGDSVRDIILGTPGGTAPGASVFLKSGRDGNTVWTWSTYTQGPNWGWVYAVHEFADLNRDGYPEVLAAAGGNSDDRSGTVFCFNGHTGDTIWTFRVPDDGAQSVSPIADINGDSIPEVAVAAGGNDLDNHVYLLNGRTGRQLWSYDMHRSVQTVDRIRSFVNPGKDDVIAGSWNYNAARINAVTGAPIWDVPLGTGRVVMKVMPIRDLNHDSVDDVLVGSWSNDVTVLNGRDGSVLWSQTVGADCWNVDTLADVTGDSIPEAVVGALNGRTVEVFSGATHDALWSYSFQERIYDVVSVPDLDGDGHPDVMVCLQDQQNQANHLFAFKGTVVEAATEPREPVRTVLLSRQGDCLQVSGPPGARCRLSLVDCSGRVLENLFAGRLSAGRMPVSLAGRRIPSGCSFALLESESGTTSVKLVTVR